MDEGSAFRSTGLWTASSFFQPPASDGDDEQSLFAPLDCSLPTLDLLKDPGVSLDVFAGSLRSLSLSVDQQKATEPEQASPPLAQTSSSPPRILRQAETEQLLPWDLDANCDETSANASLYTWDAISGRNDQPCSNRPSTTFSEAGQAAFDASISLQQASNKSPFTTGGVVAWSAMLPSLRNLVVGRSSELFPWAPERDTFLPCLPQTPISGLSLDCTRDAISRVVLYGAQLRRLRTQAVAADRLGPTCAVVVALRLSFENILDALETSVSQHLAHIQSMVQLQNLISMPHLLLAEMQSLLDSVKEIVVDEEAISVCADHQVSLAERGSQFTTIFGAVLAHVTSPWLEALAQDLGLQAKDRLASSAHIGFLATQSAQPRLSEPIGSPSFLEPHDRVLIEDIKTCKEYIRKEPIEYWTESLSSMTSIMTVDAGDHFSSARMRDDLTDSLYTDDFRKLDFRLADLAEPGQICRHNFQPLMQRLFRLSAYPINDDENELHEHEYLLVPNLDPLGTIRPALEARAHELNKVIINRLFKIHRLRDHLQLQQDYHLFENGDFVSRLSSALFSADTQLSERKRGVIPTSERIGLQLDAGIDRSWPPASSELRLTLAGILDETSRVRPKTLHSGKENVLGELSFSIRELSDLEIERVLDPNSIYALDFLRLQYETPSPLSEILTPVALERYDTIFRFMLRMLRLRHVTATLRGMLLKTNKASSLWTSDGKHQRAFLLASFEASHVSSVLMSHFMEVGIREPSKTMMQVFDTAERQSQPGVSSKREDLGPRALCAAHDACLETIRSRLFLRAKQESPRLAMENLFTAMLNLSHAQDTAAQSRAIRAFRDEMRGLLEALQALAQKLASKTTTDERDALSSGHVRLLISRLDYDRFCVERERERER